MKQRICPECFGIVGYDRVCLCGGDELGNSKDSKK
jgi:hypothetical protein